MAKLPYVTGNHIKFNHATAACKPAGIELEQTLLDIVEIQSETGEPVAQDKAAKAFAALGKPLVVSDDCWMIPGLKNFPGPYMKSMNEWFTPEDWLRLTRELSNRTIILRQIVMYQDTHSQELFVVDIPGLLLHEIRGDSPDMRTTHSTIISFDGGKTSAAEHHSSGESAAKHHHTAWHEFADWYVAEKL